MKRILRMLGVINFVASSASLTMAASLKSINIIKRANKIVENVKLETPITKVTAFYFNDSAESTFVWTKALPVGAKYNFFNVKVKYNSNYWVEGLELGYSKQNILSRLYPPINIPLVNNTHHEQVIIEKNSGDFIMGNFHWKKTEIINLKLILNLEYFNDVVFAKLTARIAVKNTSLFSWVKAQAKFYVKVGISENKVLF